MSRVSLMVGLVVLLTVVGCAGQGPRSASTAVSEVSTPALEQAAAAAPTIAANPGGAGQGGTSGAPVVIRFAYPEYMTAFNKANYEKLAEAFNAENPGVKVELLEISNDTLMEAMNKGTDYLEVVFDPELGADVLLSRPLQNLAGDTRLLDLEPLIATHPEVALDDFYPMALDQVRKNGTLRGLPAELDMAVLYYNKDLFDQAGVAYPTATWTRDDFLAAAAALRKALPERKLTFAAQVDDVVPFIYTHGGKVQDGSAYTLTDPRTVEAVRWFAGLALEQDIIPLPKEMEAYRPELGEDQGVSTVTMGGDGAPEAELRWSGLGAQAEMAGQQGDAALWSGRLSDRQGTGGWQWEFQWGVAPWPRDQVEIAMTHVYAYCISASTADPAAALRWVDYLTRQPPNMDGIPARRSVAASDTVRQAFAREIGAEAYDECLAAIDQATPVAFNLYTGAELFLGQPLLDILEKGQDVEAALSAAQAGLEKNP